MNTKDAALKLAIDFIEQVHERHGVTLLGESVLNKCKAALSEQQKPLSEDMIQGIAFNKENWVGLSGNTFCWKEFARAIERAHGIGE